MNPKISVVIPAYNQAEYIAQALKSVLAQTYSPDEIIVVDDGSTDDTKKALAPYKDKIKYIYEENQGAACARNVGIQDASGEYIAFLDADDIWSKDKLGKQVDLLRVNRSLGLLHTGYFRFAGSCDNTIPERIAGNSQGLCGYVFPELLWHNFIVTSSVLVKRICFQDIGMFDEEFRRAQDYEMWLRICRKYQVGYVQEALVGYRMNNHKINGNIDISYKAEERLIKKALRNYAEMENMSYINKRFAKLYLDYGLDLLEQERLSEAREKFFTSLRYYPLNSCSLRNYFKCLLPYRLFKTLKKVKKSTFKTNK